MAVGWKYRIQSAGGTLLLTVLAIIVANHPVVQEGLSHIPVLGGLPAETYTNGHLSLALLLTSAVVFVFMWPLFKPRPRRILDVISESVKRIFLSMFALATIGYFDLTYHLPRRIVIVLTAFLAVTLPFWLVLIRRPPEDQTRAVLVGDDIEVMLRTLEAATIPVIGYVGPPQVQQIDQSHTKRVQYSDGGRVVESELDSLDCLGGLSRLDEVFVEHEVDTALLGFSRSDRGEFFGTLASCYEHGVTALVHREYADSVLTSGIAGKDLIKVNLEPLDWADHFAKRLFDLTFAVTALVCLSPVIALIAVAIKLDTPGPVLYAQERTAEFGDTFTVYKFRSMVADAESQTGVKLSEEDKGETDPRVTRVGRLLRRTHLDEIPQLWSIIVGDMSVVGPRPERPELDENIEEGIDQWPRRWFVRPGLTGLAQIRGATGHEPARKLRYDIEYIRRQSFWFDLKIVIRQIWQVLGDLVTALRGSGDRIK